MIDTWSLGTRRPRQEDWATKRNLSQSELLLRPMGPTPKRIRMKASARHGNSRAMASTPLGNHSSDIVCIKYLCTLWSTTVAYLQFWSSNEKSYSWGHHTWGTVLKLRSKKKVQWSRGGCNNELQAEDLRSIQDFSASGLARHGYTTSVVCILSPFPSTPRQVYLSSRPHWSIYYINLVSNKQNLFA